MPAADVLAHRRRRPSPHFFPRQGAPVATPPATAARGAGIVAAVRAVLRALRRFVACLSEGAITPAVPRSSPSLAPSSPGCATAVPERPSSCGSRRGPRALTAARSSSRRRPRPRWIADRFARVLQTCAAAVLGPRARSMSSRPASAAGAAGRPAQASHRPERGAQPQVHLRPVHHRRREPVRPRGRARRRRGSPAQAYNPLFVYGPPGVGKTHLLHAIGNYVQLIGGGLRSATTTAEPSPTPSCRYPHAGAARLSRPASAASTCC